jgi:TolB-like protein
MSSDKEQEHFADGLTEDLITDLSRNAGLFVISRNSTFAFKNKHMDARRIASDLGVRFLLEGSARRAGNRIRVNVQLIEAATGVHIWAERFDREIQDIFAVQDEVTAKIVGALVGRLIQTPVRTRTSSIEAYDLCVRARLLQATSAGSISGLREGQKLLYKALAIDPTFAEAHRWLAFNCWSAWAHCYEPMDEYRPVSVEHAERAVKLDPNDAGTQWVLGYILSFERRWAEVDSAFARALEIDPNNADALAALTDIAVMRGEPGVALEHIQKAMRLDPHPLGWFYWELGLAQYAAKQYDAAVETLRKDATYKTGSRRILAASLAQLGLLDDARREATLYLADNPRFTISHWASTQPYRDDAALAHFVEGYRKAGLPE